AGRGALRVGGVYGGRLEEALQLGLLFEEVHTYLFTAAAVPCGAFARLAMIRYPSVPPRSASAQRSGCGMRPTTFPARFDTPAMFASAPLGFASAVAAPAASVYRNTSWPAASTAASVSGSATQRPSPWPIGMRSTWRRRPVVNGVRSLSMRTWIQSQRYSSDAFRTSAPGSSPASQRIWKPLQLPRTAPPSSAKRRSSYVPGESLAIAPARR